MLRVRSLTRSAYALSSTTRSAQHINVQYRPMSRRSRRRGSRDSKDVASASPPPPAVRTEDAWEPVVDEATNQTVSCYSISS